LIDFAVFLLLSVPVQVIASDLRNDL